MSAPNYLILALALSLALLGGACAKEHVNPYDREEAETTLDSSGTRLDPASIAGLHANIFSKTCANSGCHDGSFEPDFRTIESSYNTLVWQPVIKNDPQRRYEYRVKPSDPEMSVLMARLTFDIDGRSGIMPLAVDPGSDWLQKREEYIDNVKTWIRDGARDMEGKEPVLASHRPQLLGFAAKAGNEWLGRANNEIKSIAIPKHLEKVVLYVAFQDDETPATELSELTARFSHSRIIFHDSTAVPLRTLPAPEKRPGYFNHRQNVDYHHMVEINPHDHALPGQPVFVRFTVKDADNPVVELPSNGSSKQLIFHCSFVILEE
jgi:hypothetical protein